MKIRLSVFWLMVWNN